MNVVSGLLSSDNEACQKLEFESILLKILALLIVQVFDQHTVTGDFRGELIHSAW
jgi:hypothetical protein